jgi:hypothetical protein
MADVVKLFWTLLNKLEGATTLIITALSKTTLSIMTLSIMAA